jgi:hypothetical protein
MPAASKAEKEQHAAARLALVVVWEDLLTRPDSPFDLVHFKTVGAYFGVPHVIEDFLRSHSGNEDLQFTLAVSLLVELVNAISKLDPRVGLRRYAKKSA